MTDLADSRPFAPVIRTQADLESAWRRLMQPLGFSRASLWLMLIQADGVPLPQLTEVADCPGDPVRNDLDALAAMLAQLWRELSAGRPGARWALLRSRPGATAVDDEDRRWAAMLHAACAAADVPIEPLHVATDHDVRPVPVDELDDGRGSGRADALGRAS